MKITIAGRSGAGKTTIALLIRRLLEDAGVNVSYENPDGPHASRSALSFLALAGSLVSIREPVTIEERTE